MQHYKKKDLTGQIILYSGNNGKAKIGFGNKVLEKLRRNSNDESED